jgi:hypothetical protein
MIDEPSIDQSSLFPISRLDIFDSIVVSISACHPQDSSQEAGVRFPVGEIRFFLPLLRPEPIVGVVEVLGGWVDFW